MSNKKLTIENELQKVQKEFSQINDKYVSEVRNGMEKFKSAAEDRTELNSIIAELKEEVSEYKTNANELRLEI